MSARVLVIGASAEVVRLVAQEVAARGIDIRGATIGEAGEHAGRRFDLVAFGRGVPEDRRTELQTLFRQNNPAVRFLRTYAPYAASQIVEASQGRDRPPVELNAYCERIGYHGPLEPTLDVLKALHELHPAAIPFEAIDVLLDRAIRLEPEAIDSKLIHRRRGGYCFEQNSLFKRVLQAIGFEVEGMAASVLWMGEPGAPPPSRTHMVLRVTIDGVPWLADVGFGSCVPTRPLRLDSVAPQPTRHETFRLLPRGNGVLLQAEIEGEWRPVYDLLLEPMLDNHYEMPNWFTSTHPSSHFRHRLIVARTTNEARYTLLENRLSIRRPGVEMEKHMLDSDGIERALREVFTLPVEPSWRPLIERAAAPALPQDAPRAVAHA